MARRMVLATVIGAIALAAVSSAVPMADLGGATSGASGINDAGIVVGASDLPPLPSGQTVGHAYKRLPDDSVIDLGTLPGHESSAATRINANGTVIGSSWRTVDPSAWPPVLVVHAVMWDPAGQITDLGSGTELLAINATGVIVGESGGKAAVYDPAVGHVQALPDLPGGAQSRAHDINDLGEVVGYQYVDSLVTPVRWNLADGTAEDLTDLFDNRFAPYSINNRGTIGGMVLAGPPGSQTPQAAVVLAGTTETINLGAGDWSAAYALNESDTAAVVRFSDADALRWQPTTGLVDLAPDTVSYAMDVNEAGSLVGVSDGRAVFFGLPSS